MEREFIIVKNINMRTDPNDNGEIRARMLNLIAGAPFQVGICRVKMSCSCIISGNYALLGALMKIIVN